MKSLPRKSLSVGFFERLGNFFGISGAFKAEFSLQDEKKTQMVSFEGTLTQCNVL